MTEIERLIAIEEIKTVKARYCRFVDTKDWDGLRDLFARDARFDGSNGPGEVADRDAFVAAASVPLARCVSVHHIHIPEISFQSDTAASAIWPMEDMLRWEDDADDPLRSLHGYGHYHETYEKVGARWLIKTWAITRLRVDVVGRDDARAG